MRELARLDAIMPLTLEERGAFVTLCELAAERGGFVPDQERWISGWMQCSVRKWRLIRSALITKGKLAESTRAGEFGFVVVSMPTRSRTDDDSSSSHARVIAETETKPNEINEASRPREARVGDNNPTSEDTCSGGGVGGVAREGVNQTDDWPEGDHAELLVEAAASPWLDPQKSHGLVLSAGRLEAWRRRGASWKRHVLPVVVALAKQNGEPINHWKFFENAIGRSIQASRAEMELPEGVIPLRPGGGVGITDRIAAERAESERLAFAMLDARNGRTN